MTAPDGRHLSFPFRIGADGRTAGVASREEHVRDEIIQLILTNPGERPFLPEFGGGARRLVFEGAGYATVTMAKAMLSQALSRWLGHRITVAELTVEAENETISVDLTYRIAGTEDPRRLRFERRGG
ncbi:MAG: GPW/gp25 family protein [Rhodospirillaceae bacterium]|nr:GPW/gp25 family protein [Rhodospirillaceae bacterium]